MFAAQGSLPRSKVQWVWGANECQSGGGERGRDTRQQREVRRGRGQEQARFAWARGGKTAGVGITALSKEWGRKKGWVNTSVCHCRDCYFKIKRLLQKGIGADMYRTFLFENVYKSDKVLAGLWEQDLLKKQPHSI